jgi:tRNA G18 (ribose-2'-O)-methylase SpoU
MGIYRPQLSKVALGAEKTVPWEKVFSTLRLLKKLKTEGYRIFSIEQAENSIPYYKAPKNGKFCLILGNEVSGLPKNILSASDEILEIPMRGKKESLNVSVSAGIAIFGILYRR